jgi:Na+/H+ antiporter NhaD/arsenite permease-like protein
MVKSRGTSIRISIYAAVIMLSAYLIFSGKVALDPIYTRAFVIITSLIIANTGILASREIDVIAEKITKKFKRIKKVSIILVAITFLVSIAMTNDASLLILIPITVEIGIISRKSLLNTIIMQIIAANVGSMLAPFGNPQNIIIFLRYHQTALNFITGILPAFAISVILLFAFTFFLVKDGKLKTNYKAKKPHLPLFYSSLFIFIIDVIGLLLNYGDYFFVATIAVSICILAFVRIPGSKRLGTLSRIDILLILIFFVVFMIFGSLSSIIPLPKSNSTLYQFVYAILISQVISNVPASVLLKTFNFIPLLWGVNIGGNGSVIASLANVIGLRQTKDKRKYASFLKTSFLFLIINTAVAALIISL